MKRHGGLSPFFRSIDLQWQVIAAWRFFPMSNAIKFNYL
jgi:hypothetical protein